MKLKKSLKILNVNNPFTNFNIKLSHEEIDNLSNMHINTPKYTTILEN